MDEKTEIKIHKKKLAKKKRSLFLLRAVKVTSGLVAALMLIYFSAGLLLDKGFLKRDFNEKYGQVLGATTTTTLMVRIVGPPNKPVLSATSVCNDSAPQVNLSWTFDDQMDYFDLERDGGFLVAGLTENTYADEAVQQLQSYAYAVTAFNSLGQKTSDISTVTTLDCGAPFPLPPEPSCEITKFHNINLSSFLGTLSTRERKPTFYGTTNMPGAEIGIVISGETSVIATTSATANGFWTWKPQDRFNYGSHEIKATTIDPFDVARRKTASLRFEIKKEEEKKTTEEEAAIPLERGSAPVESVPEIAAGIQLSVEVKNPNDVAYPGKELSVETKIKRDEGVEPFSSELRYWIVDENYNEVFQISDQVFVDGNKTIEKKLTVPRLLKPGKYKVLVDISRNGTLIVAEDSFLLKEVPLANLGGGMVITAIQLMDNLSWFILWLWLLLIIFLLFLSLEYWESRRAIIQVTERILRERGFITRKKVS